MAPHYSKSDPIIMKEIDVWMIHNHWYDYYLAETVNNSLAKYEWVTYCILMHVDREVYIY